MDSYREVAVAQRQQAAGYSRLLRIQTVVVSLQGPQRRCHLGEKATPQLCQKLARAMHRWSGCVTAFCRKLGCQRRAGCFPRDPRASALKADPSPALAQLRKNLNRFTKMQLKSGRVDEFSSR